MSRLLANLGGGKNSVLIKDPRPDLDRVKEVKVKIPISMHIKLHSIKVLTGKQISDAVTEALEVYFGQARPDGHLMPAIAPELLSINNE